MKKRLLTLIAASTLAVSMLLTGCSSKDKGKFKVGLEAGYAPFNWTQKDDSNGAVKIEGSSEYAGGYDVQIAKKIADSLGKELVIVKTDWEGLLPAVESGKIDAIVAGMSPTAKRREAIDFSKSYYSSDLVLVVKNGGKYDGANKIEDFKGAKITGQLNTFHYSVIDQIPGVNMQTAMDNFPAMRVALESGVIDGYVSEKPEGLSAQSANSVFKMIELKNKFKTKEEDVQIAVGLKKNSELTDKINKALEGISEADRNKIMEDAIKQQPAAK